MAAILAVFLLLSVITSYSTRLKYGPDEPAHYIYVRSIAQDFAFPELSHEITPTEDSASTHQAQHPPLYYALAAIPYFAFDHLGADGDAIWRVLRLFTILIGLGWIYFTYRLAREFFPHDDLAVLTTTGLVALMPGGTYTCGVINNDAQIALTCTCALWMMLIALRRNEMSLRLAVWLGVVIGLAILTKAQGLTLIPTLVVAAVVIAKRNSWKGSGVIAGRTAIALGVAAAVSGWWFVRNIIVYGEPIVQSLYNPAVNTDPISLVAQPLVLLPMLTQISKQFLMCFWTPFWLIKPFVNEDIYFRLLLALSFLGVIGTLMCMARPRPEHNNRCLAASYLVPLLPGVLIYVMVIYQTLFVDRGLFQQGRLLLPVAGVLAIWLVGGLRRLVPQKAAVCVFATLLAGALIGNVFTIRLIRMFYRVVEPGAGP